MSKQNYDKNFTMNETAEAESTVWYPIPCDPFEIYGLLPEKDGLLSRRMPLAVAETVSDGIHPNDLGFYRMAGKIGPVIARALGIAEQR